MREPPYVQRVGGSQPSSPKGSRDHPDHLRSPPVPAWPSVWEPRRWRRGRWSVPGNARSSPRWWRTRRLCEPWSGSWVSRGQPGTVEGCRGTPPGFGAGLAGAKIRVLGGPPVPQGADGDSGRVGDSGRGVPPGLLSPQMTRGCWCSRRAGQPWPCSTRGGCSGCSARGGCGPRWTPWWWWCAGAAASRRPSCRP